MFFPGEYGEVLESWRGLEATSADLAAGPPPGADRAGECGVLSALPDANERARKKQKRGEDEERLVDGVMYRAITG